MTLLIIYCILFLGLGFFEYFKQRDFEHFAAAGQRHGAFTVGGSIVASSVGGSATIGMAGLAFSVGTPAFWWLGSGTIGLILLTLFLAKRVRESGVYTLPDLAEKFISPQARRVLALIIIPAWGAILAAQYVAAAKIITALVPTISYFNGSILCALLIMAYTMLGGQSSILKSDIIQYFFVITGLLLAFFYTQSASTITLSQINFQWINSDFPLSRWSYFMLIMGGSYIVCPMLFSRLFAAKDAQTAQRGAAIGVVGLFLSALLIVSLGILAHGLIPAGQNVGADSILTQVIPSIMPEWGSALLLFGLLSAIISSADSCLITAATIFEHDLLQGESTARCRLIIVGLSIIGLLLALSGSSILDLLMAANDIYVCGVVVPLFAALLYPPRALNTRALLIAILAGGALGLVAALTGEKNYSYAGLAVAATLSIYSVANRKRHSH